MYPRFGMTYVAILTAQARARGIQPHQQSGAAPVTAAPVFSGADNEVVGALWRMGAVIAVIAALAGSVMWVSA